MVLPLETLLKRVANTECLDINQKKCFDSVFGNVLYNKKSDFWKNHLASDYIGITSSYSTDFQKRFYSQTGT